MNKDNSWVMYLQTKKKQELVFMQKTQENASDKLRLLLVEYDSK